MRRIGALTFLLLLGACTGWKTVPVGEPGPLPQEVRVWPQEGEPILLENAQVTTDSLVGWDMDRRGGTRVAFATTEVDRVETFYRAMSQTTGLGIAGLVLFALLATGDL